MTPTVVIIGAHAESVRDAVQAATAAMDVHIIAIGSTGPFRANRAGDAFPALATAGLNFDSSCAARLARDAMCERIELEGTRLDPFPLVFRIPAPAKIKVDLDCTAREEDPAKTARATHKPNKHGSSCQFYKGLHYKGRREY